MKDRRVVITGLGTVNPAGSTAGETWTSLRASKPAPRSPGADCSRPLPRVGEIDFTGLPIRKRDINRMNRADVLGVAAAGKAALDAGANLCDSAGLFLGTTKDTSCQNDLLQLLEPVAERGFERGAAQMVEIATQYLTPFLLLDCMPNLALHYISEIFKLRGDNCCFLHTGAAGTSAMIEASRAIRSGRIKMALAGGFDSTLDRLNLARFSALGLLSDNPGEAACRPFNRSSDGFLLGEGGAVVCLEDRDFALERGATIYGEILGAGSACQPLCEANASAGRSVERAVTAALASAMTAAEEVGMIVASGEGTPWKDRAEACGIRSALKGAADHVPVTAFKGVYGHLLAGAGPLDAIMALKALEAGEIPSICGCDDPDETLPVRLVHGQSLSTRAKTAIVISTGAGGQACALALAGGA
jgi:3-oxoacyl-[acyl-carrier-protein] synthase II